MNERPAAPLAATGAAAAAPRAYRAVCFDLDGTLLPMELDEFLGAYFQAIGSFVAAHGLDAQAFSAGLSAGIKAMAAHDGSRTNAEAFWDTFFGHVEGGRDVWLPLLNEFYERDFGAIGANVAPDAHAVRAVGALADKGYPLALTTMPLFPRRAVEWRLTWAGIDPALFARITTFENSTSVKPKPAYYAENLAALGAAGEDVLMVGNNTVEDLAFCSLGADAFLVTDHLLDPAGFDVETVRHGSMAEFAAWADALPACADPATGILDGLVPADAANAAPTAATNAAATAPAAASAAAPAAPGTEG